MMETIELRHGHLFCGLGGGGRGFNRGQARVGNLRAQWRCIGGIDNDPAAIKDFERLTGASGTCRDLFSLNQYRAFFGKEPPPGWVEAIPDDVRRAFGYEHPHAIFLSAPCKGFSGLLAERQSRTAKYQALNELTLRGVWLALEAYKDDPVPLFIFENVPRIMTRGRHLLDQIVALLRAYGYVVAETTHDCGEIGALAQSRKRFLLVARHPSKVPAFLYEPVKHALASIGSVLERFPLPGPWDTSCGPMHRMPALQWKTWVRLAFVEAGSDWRSLNKLAVDNGFLRDFGIAPEPGTEWFNGAFGVKDWGDNAGTVTSKFQPSSGATSVADPRVEENTFAGLTLNAWDETPGAITTQRSPGSSAQSVADPRIHDRTPFNNAYRIVPWEKSALPVTSARGSLAAVADPRHLNWKDSAHRNKERVHSWPQHAGAVTGKNQVASGALSVADPRPAQRDDYKQTKYRVSRMEEASGAVIAASTTGNGAFAVADPRTSFGDKRENYQTGGHYGVNGWEGSTGAVAAAAGVDNGRWSVADPRTGIAGSESEKLSGTAQNIHGFDALPQLDRKLVCVIRALDGTWHRPLTTLELAALQGLVDPEEHLELEGLSDSAWRERIGNAVPPPSAQAIAGVMGRALLASMTGETFALSSEPIWVRPIATALSVKQGEFDARR